MQSGTPQRAAPLVHRKRLHSAATRHEPIVGQTVVPMGRPVPLNQPLCRTAFCLRHDPLSFPSAWKRRPASGGFRPGPGSLRKAMGPMRCFSSGRAGYDLGRHRKGHRSRCRPALRRAVPGRRGHRRPATADSDRTYPVGRGARPDREGGRAAPVADKACPCRSLHGPVGRYHPLASRPLHAQVPRA